MTRSKALDAAVPDHSGCRRATACPDGEEWRMLVALRHRDGREEIGREGYHPSFVSAWDTGRLIVVEAYDWAPLNPEPAES